MAFLGKKILLLGSGELGKEITIAAQRLGLSVVAADKYPNAPAMQVADDCEVFSMLDGQALAAAVKKHQPDYIVPEVESIRTTKLQEFEKQGYTVVPTAQATHLTMNRDAIRDMAAHELGLRTARFAYADNLEELKEVSKKIGYPNVVKPVMSSSGKGQSVVKKKSQTEKAWKYACEGMRGDTQKVIVEEFISFDLEITLLTVKQKKGPTLFVDPIGHVQESGDYRESWIPAKMNAKSLRAAKAMAKKVTDKLGGAGLFGVEFFITKDEVIFSELSPRPHDTGMVTMISQDLSEFELHLRAILGLPIPKIQYYGPSASAVILADREAANYKVEGLERALLKKNLQVRLFGKPDTRKGRRLGVVLAQAKSVKAARRKALEASRQIKIRYKN